MMDKYEQLVVAGDGLTDLCEQRVQPGRVLEHRLLTAGDQAVECVGGGPDFRDFAALYQLRLEAGQCARGEP